MIDPGKTAQRVMSSLIIGTAAGYMVKNDPGLVGGVLTLIVFFLILYPMTLAMEFAVEYFDSSD